jgi:nucleoside-diphosphate-sugar epimerase
VLNKDRKTSVFVTGINSELMRRFVAKLPRDQYDIFGLSRKNIDIDGVKMISGDLKDHQSWKHHLQNIDVCIHAAATTHAFSEQEYSEINVTATKELIDSCIDFQVGKFILISSRTAGELSGHYGFSKLKAEQYLIDNFKNYIIFRPAEIFGGQKGEGIDQLLIDAKTKKIIPCPVGIKHKLWPISLDDTVELMYQYSFENTKSNYIKVLNGPEGYTMKEIIHLVAKTHLKSPIIIPIPKPILFLIKKVLEIIKIDIGIKPDQIDRLYAPKPVEIIKFNFEKLEDFIALKL